MAHLKIEREYRCDNDCKMEGCPGHTASLEFISSANIYIFNDGQGRQISFDISLASAMIDMFRHYSETRKDTVQI